MFINEYEYPLIDVIYFTLCQMTSGYANYPLKRYPLREVWPYKVYLASSCGATCGSGLVTWPNSSWNSSGTWKGIPMRKGPSRNPMENFCVSASTTVNQNSTCTQIPIQHVHPSNWKRPPGRPRITWLNTVQRDLRAYNLTLNKAVDLAKNCPLWRLMSTYGAMHS